LSYWSLVPVFRTLAKNTRCSVPENLPGIAVTTLWGNFSKYADEKVQSSDDTARHFGCYWTLSIPRSGTMTFQPDLCSALPRFGGELHHDPVNGEEMSAWPHTDQLTRVTAHLPVRFCSIHRWLPRARPGVESSDDEKVVR